MKHSLPFPTPIPRLQQPREADEVGGEGVAEEAVEVGVVVRQTRPQLDSRSSRELNIRISQKAIGPGAVTISDTGKVHTFVRNQPLVLGRIFLCRDLERKIEKLTSSVVI